MSDPEFKIGVNGVSNTPLKNDAEVVNVKFSRLKKRIPAFDVLGTKSKDFKEPKSSPNPSIKKMPLKKTGKAHPKDKGQKKRLNFESNLIKNEANRPMFKILGSEDLKSDDKSNFIENDFYGVYHNIKSLDHSEETLINLGFVKKEKKIIDTDVSSLGELIDSLNLETLDDIAPLDSCFESLLSEATKHQIPQISSEVEPQLKRETRYKPKREKNLISLQRKSKLESNVVKIYEDKRLNEIKLAWNCVRNINGASAWMTVLELNDGVLMILRLVKSFYCATITIKDWNMLSSIFLVLKCVSKSRLLYFKSIIASEMLRERILEKIIFLLISPPGINHETASVVHNIVVYYEDIILYSDNLLIHIDKTALLKLLKECLIFFLELKYDDKVFVKRLNFIIEKIEVGNFYTSLLCYPTDLLSGNKYWPIIEKGAFNNIYHYVNTHFNLFKEDFEHSLRNGLLNYLSGSKDPENITIYENVNLNFRKGSDQSQGGYFIKFNSKHIVNMRHVHWRSSSMFFYGSLILLSKDNFKTYILAKAGDRKDVEKGSGKLPISFILVPEVIDLQSTYSMAEATNYFDAYCAVMKVLRMMPKYKFPFQKYIVFGECENVHPPKYLNVDQPYFIDGYEVAVSDRNTYPSPEELGLNPYQLDCLFQALNNEICLIQGPPGTGKTFMCKQIIKVLLENKNMWSNTYNTPIVVICYKNLSLDEILDNLLKDDVKVCRIGSNSKNEELALFFKLGGLEPPQDSFAVKWVFAQLRELENKILNELDLIFKRLFLIHENHGLQNLKIFHTVLKNEDMKFLERKYLEWIFNLKIYDERIIAFKTSSYYALTTSDLMAKFIELKTSAPSESTKSELDLNSYLQDMLKKLLNFKTTMKPEEVEILKNKSPEMIEKLEERWTWYYANIEETKNLLNIKARVLTQKNMDLKGRLLENFNLYDSRKIAQSNIEVIGLTTTASARLNILLEELKPRILIVEEAAEVIEGHCVAALNQHCEHLILFGDHKQLRPLSKSYELSEECNLSLSLFERLTNNGIVPAVLKRQYRMRPEISSLITPSIYEYLEDDISVTKFPDVAGMSKNVFFFDHKNQENQALGSRSVHNVYELQFALNLALYLVNRGHDAKSITIIAMYGEQEKMLSKERGKLKIMFPELEHVIIATVDSYQGKQNNIVILCLVRNNLKGNVGFLKTPNRVCVALSRARHGLYIFGNLGILAKQSEMWSHVLKELTKQKAVVSSFTISCHKHNQKIKIVDPYSLKMYAKGGCLKFCAEELPCGHKCTFMCHGRDLKHENQDEYACVKLCEKSLECGKEHQCILRCHNETVVHLCNICPPPPKSDDESSDEDVIQNQPQKNQKTHTNFRDSPTPKPRIRFEPKSKYKKPKAKTHPKSG